MNIEAALVDFLKKNDGVKAVVGTRIYPQIVPQGAAFPALVYQRIPGPEPQRDMSGALILTKASFQIICLGMGGQAYSQAKAARDAVFAALGNYSGAFGDLEALDILVVDEADDVELPQDLIDAKICGVRMDILIII